VLGLLAALPSMSESPSSVETRSAPDSLAATLAALPSISESPSSVETRSAPDSLAATLAALPSISESPSSVPAFLIKKISWGPGCLWQRRSFQRGRCCNGRPPRRVNCATARLSNVVAAARTRRVNCSLHNPVLSIRQLPD
jgi:hypothetical protein